MLAHFIRPNGWRDLWAWMPVLLGAEPLLQSRVQTNTLKPKGTDFTRHMETQQGPGGDRHRCTCRKQLILLPPHLGSPCLDQCQHHRERGGVRTSERLNVEHFSHNTKVFSSPVTQEKQHQQESAARAARMKRWGEIEVTSYCAWPHVLTSPFISDDLGFYEVQKLFGWHSFVHLPSYVLLSGLRRCWTMKTGQITPRLLQHICHFDVIQLIMFWMLFKRIWKTWLLCGII